VNFYQAGDGAEEFDVDGAEVTGTLSYHAYPSDSIADVYAEAVANTPSAYAGGQRIRIRCVLLAGELWRVDVAFGTPTADKGVIGDDAPTTLPSDPPAADPVGNAPVESVPPAPLPALEGQVGGPPGDGSFDPPGGGDGGTGAGGGLPQQVARDAPLGPEWSFDTSGGTTKMLESKSVKVAKLYGGGAAPDVRKAIGATADDVEGVDVYTPKLAISVTYPVRRVAGGYLDTLSALTGRTNDAPFLFWAKNEVLFVGAQGKYQGRGGWSVTYNFLISKTEVDIRSVEPVPGGDERAQVGLVVDRKEGWWVLDVGYSPQEVGTGANKRVVKIPDRVYVHEVYRPADLTALGFR